jgi:hypothetical protein
VRALLVVGLLLTATPALADDPARLYVGASGDAGVDLWFRSGLGVEVGFRPSVAEQLWWRGRVVGGGFNSDPMTGRYVMATVGIEGLHCAGSTACLVGGVDLGGALLRWDRHYDSAATDGSDVGYIQSPDDLGFVALPRIGVELHSAHVALRFMIQGFAGAVGDIPGVGASVTTALLARF